MKRLATALALGATACAPAAPKPPPTPTTVPLPVSTAAVTAPPPSPAPEAEGAAPVVRETAVVTTTTAPAPPHPPSTTVAPRDPHPPSQTAQASWYARGARTANGEAFDPDGATFAHRTMAFGSMVRFCHDGRCVVARCNDRGPAAWTGKTFDLSRGAFAAIAPLGAGVVTVTWEAA